MNQNSSPCPRANVLGVGVHALNLKTALERILDALDHKRRGYICVTGVHGVSEAQRDPQFRHILNRAFLCTPDGMPMVWVGHAQGHRDMSRVYGPDLMLDVLAASQDRGYRHFFYGSTAQTVGHLRGNLLRRFPRLQIVGTYEPPFRPLDAEELKDLVRQVDAARPDMMWIGLSTPKQEKFMAEHLPLLNVTLMAGVGAAFDFHAGTVKQAPRWMQRSGLEWLFRLGSDPRRLWRRYLKNNPLFLLRIFCQFTRLKRYRIDD